MPDRFLDPRILETALFDRRFTALARANVDLAGVTTWDPKLDRRTRLLVPIDVQAFVVPASGGEATVAIAGAGDDPDPFADGVVRPSGVHLHWAMPDALLHGRDRPTPPGTTPLGPEFPLLPDRWVVFRALFPVGMRTALLRGWVIDAQAKTVTALPDFNGTPAEGDPEERMMRLDAGFGGSLLWTASYTASEGRFGFFDPLNDLPAAGSTDAPQGLDAAGAVYIVSGWWNDLAQDPLAGSTGPRRLDARLAELGWYVVHDASDEVLETEDPRFARIRRGLGLVSPADSPPVSAAMMSRDIGKLEALDLQVAVPVSAAESVLVGRGRPRYATMLHGAVLGVPLGALPAGIDDRPAPGDMSVAVGTDIDDVVAAYGANTLGVSAENRAAAERLTAAFTSDLLDRIGSADGIADLSEREHADGFSSLPGTPLPGVRPDRLRGEDTVPLGPHAVGRKGRSSAAVAKAPVNKGANLRWREKLDLFDRSVSMTSSARSISEVEGNKPPAEVREITKPAPRWFRPEPPVVAVRGAHPNHRHHGDGLYDDSGRLRCRYPRECVPAWEGVVSGEVVVPSIGSRAVPDEVLPVVREAVLVNGYAYQWLAAAGATTTGGQVGPLRTRLAAEMVLVFPMELSSESGG